MGGREASESIKLGITVLLFTLVLSSLLLVSKVAMATYDAKVEEVQVIAGNVGTVELYALSAADVVSAPTLYKALAFKMDLIETLSITYLDGTQTSDVNTLLKRGSCKMRVRMQSTSQGLFNVTLVEVDEN